MYVPHLKHYIHWANQVSLSNFHTPWAIKCISYQIFYHEFYLFHISSHAFIPLLTCSLLQCCIELTVLWVSVTVCNSKVRLAHGKPVLCGWAHLVVPVGFGCPGGFSRCFSTACSACSRSQGACVPKPSHATEEHRDVPSRVSDPDRMMDRPQPVSCVCVCICTVYICTHSRILAILANVYWLPYDFE